MAKRKSTKGQITITKHTYKTKDGVTRTSLRKGNELRRSFTVHTQGLQLLNQIEDRNLPTNSQWAS